MQDFDVKRNERLETDRVFRIGGETFVYRAAVAPEAIMRWSQFATDGDKEQALLASARMRLHAAQSMEPAMAQNEIARLQIKLADAQDAAATTGASEDEWVQLIDDTVIAVIEPEYADAWHKVRSPDAVHPLNLTDLQELIEWLIAAVVGRPTEPPSDSPSLDGTTETPSTDASSPPAAAESTEPETEPVVAAAV